jgi:hypothetical protein
VSILAYSQDIVYDTIPSGMYWLRVKGGVQETMIKQFYETSGILVKSKVFASAGLLDGMIYNQDYRDYHFTYDTLTYEIHSNQALNLLVYRYYYNDSVYTTFAGLRKAPMGAGIFEGQYLDITPIIPGEAIVRIYNGIGASRSLFLTLRYSDLTEASLRDYSLTSEVTIQTIKVSKILRVSMSKDTIIEDPDKYGIRIWPNPTNSILNIEILNNPGVNIRLYNYLPLLVYQQNNVYDELTIIDVSSFSTGSYVLVLSDVKTGSIIYTTKIIITHQHLE